jgi:hypothetical protein
VGRVLHDEDLAQAINDHVLERGRLLRLGVLLSEPYT